MSSSFSGEHRPLQFSCREGTTARDVRPAQDLAPRSHTAIKNIALLSEISRGRRSPQRRSCAARGGRWACSAMRWSFVLLPRRRSLSFSHPLALAQVLHIFSAPLLCLPRARSSARPAPHELTMLPPAVASHATWLFLVAVLAPGHAESARHAGCEGWLCPPNLGEPSCPASRKRYTFPGMNLSLAPPNQTPMKRGIALSHPRTSAEPNCA